MQRRSRGDPRALREPRPNTGSSADGRPHAAAEGGSWACAAASAATISPTEQPSPAEELICDDERRSGRSQASYARPASARGPCTQDEPRTVAERQRVEARRRAMPKSETRIDPSSATRRFPGFTSRCTTPRACAASSATAVCSSPARTGSYSTRPSRSRSACRPGYSMTMNGRPSSFSPTSWIVTTYGSPDSLAAVCASRRARAELVLARVAIGEHLDRHRAAETLVGRAPDVPHPPRAMIPTTS